MTDSGTIYLVVMLVVIALLSPFAALGFWLKYWQLKTLADKDKPRE